MKKVGTQADRIVTFMPQCAPHSHPQAVSIWVLIHHTVPISFQTLFGISFTWWQALTDNSFSLLDLSELSSLRDTWNSPVFLLLCTYWALIASARDPWDRATGMLFFAALIGHYLPRPCGFSRDSTHKGNQALTSCLFHLWNWDSQAWIGSAGKRCLPNNAIIPPNSLVFEKKGRWASLICHVWDQKSRTKYSSVKASSVLFVFTQS